MKLLFLVTYLFIIDSGLILVMMVFPSKDLNVLYKWNNVKHAALKPFLDQTEIHFMLLLYARTYPVRSLLLFLTPFLCK